MKILCNGMPVALEEPCSLYSLMAEKGLLEKKGIAAAVNNTVIPKNEWDQFILHDDDNVLLITAVQGG
ncbi:MAG: sulfur carrier protein ThiS [Chloroflexia bacterium]|nr:sulfur carrier protein ThiS [Chloroflexia bacterium]